MTQGTALWAPTLCIMSAYIAAASSLVQYGTQPAYHATSTETQALLLHSTASLFMPHPSPTSNLTTYWLPTMNHNSDVVWTGDTVVTADHYPVFRNVKRYGAKGDGRTDDTSAIQAAVFDGHRCGQANASCDFRTTSPAIVYFPPGTYVVSQAIALSYYTQIIGDATHWPVIQAADNFEGLAVLDADPYVDGNNLFTPQNNFFRQVRNLCIDLTRVTTGSPKGIHWQVAQATSLQNIVFKMPLHNTNATGIFIENGSGGFIGDLVFHGGRFGALIGSQQFTSRNLTFNDCETAIYMLWSWGWTFQGITINGGTTGIDMAHVAPIGTQNQTVGSILLADSTFANVRYGLRFAYQNSSSNLYATGGTVVLDNVDMSTGVTAAVIDFQNATILPAGKINTWAAGHGYNATEGTFQKHMQPQLQENVIAPSRRAPGLLNPQGQIFTRSRPQYETLSKVDFLSARSFGCIGDGKHDDTAAISSLLAQSALQNKVAYFEHGAYLVKDTIRISSGTRMTGEAWPLIVADSASFQDKDNPRPVLEIENIPEAFGCFEISDFIFETNGPALGAIMIQWNLQCRPGHCGMWDTHVRIGGSVGTNLESTECAAGSSVADVQEQACNGVFLMFYAAPSSSGVYVENCWFWIADHALDEETSTKLDISSPRGVLIQSEGPVWLWGTASEHSLLYNYQFDGVQALFAGFMQSETPYMQPNLQSLDSYRYNPSYDDPLFTMCGPTSPEDCKDAWGLRILNSMNVLLYSTGLYSFFQNFDVSCGNSSGTFCQKNMVSILNSSIIDIFSGSTHGAQHQIYDFKRGIVWAADNKNTFCNTWAYYRT